MPTLDRRPGLHPEFRTASGRVPFDAALNTSQLSRNGHAKVAPPGGQYAQGGRKLTCPRGKSSDGLRAFGRPSSPARDVFNILRSLRRRLVHLSDVDIKSESMDSFESGPRGEAGAAWPIAGWRNGIRNLFARAIGTGVGANNTRGPHPPANGFKVANHMSDYKQLTSTVYRSR
ncbi:unnamed protein product, partial [Iphiclides podalirius]